MINPESDVEESVVKALESCLFFSLRLLNQVRCKNDE